MELREAIKERRSIRSFKAGKIAEKELLELLELATLAPSAGNLQSWEFVLVKSKEQKEKLSSAALGQYFIAEAPYVIVVCANQARSSSCYGRRGYELYSIQDTAACIQNILLLVADKGFGACWIGAFDEGKVRTVINCTKDVKPVAIIPIGLPAEKPIAPERIALKEVLHYERF
jgi:nitroreductase